MSDSDNVDEESSGNAGSRITKSGLSIVWETSKWICGSCITLNCFQVVNFAPNALCLFMIAVLCFGPFLVLITMNCYVFMYKAVYSVYDMSFFINHLLYSTAFSFGILCVICLPLLVVPTTIILNCFLGWVPVVVDFFLIFGRSLVWCYWPWDERGNLNVPREKRNIFSRSFNVVWYLIKRTFSIYLMLFVLIVAEGKLLVALLITFTLSLPEDSDVAGVYNHNVRDGICQGAFDVYIGDSKLFPLVEVCKEYYSSTKEGIFITVTSSLIVLICLFVGAELFIKGLILGKTKGHKLRFIIIFGCYKESSFRRATYIMFYSLMFVATLAFGIVFFVLEIVSISGTGYKVTGSGEDATYEHKMYVGVGFKASDVLMFVLPYFVFSVFILNEIRLILQFEGESSIDYIKLFYFPRYRNLPDLKGSFFRFLLNDPLSVLDQVQTTLSVLKTDKNEKTLKGELKKKKNSSRFGHMSWAYISGMSEADLVMLRAFFVEDFSNLKRESLINQLLFTPPASKKFFCSVLELVFLIPVFRCLWEGFVYCFKCLELHKLRFQVKNGTVVFGKKQDNVEEESGSDDENDSSEQPKEIEMEDQKIEKDGKGSEEEEEEGVAEETNKEDVEVSDSPKNDDNSELAEEETKTMMKKEDDEESDQEEQKQKEESPKESKKKEKEEKEEDHTDGYLEFETIHDHWYDRIGCWCIFKSIVCCPWRTICCFLIFISIIVFLTVLVGKDFVGYLGLVLSSFSSLLVGTRNTNNFCSRDILSHINGSDYWRPLRERLEFENHGIGLDYKRSKMSDPLPDYVFNGLMDNIVDTSKDYCDLTDRNEGAERSTSIYRLVILGTLVLLLCADLIIKYFVLFFFFCHRLKFVIVLNCLREFLLYRLFMAISVCAIYTCCIVLIFIQEFAIGTMPKVGIDWKLFIQLGGVTIVFLIKVGRVLQYDGPSAVTYHWKLVKTLFCCGEGLFFPDINVNFINLPTKDPDELLGRTITCLAMVKNRKDMNKRKKNSKFAHLGWDLVEKLDDYEIRRLKRFFFGKFSSNESKISRLCFTSPFKTKFWSNCFCCVTCCCWYCIIHDSILFVWSLLKKLIKSELSDDEESQRLLREEITTEEEELDDKDDDDDDDNRKEDEKRIDDDDVGDVDGSTDEEEDKGDDTPKTTEIVQEGTEVDTSSAILGKKDEEDEKAVGEDDVEDVDRSREEKKIDSSEEKCEDDVVVVKEGVLIDLDSLSTDDVKDKSDDDEILKNDVDIIDPTKHEVLFVKKISEVEEEKETVVVKEEEGKKIIVEEDDEEEKRKLLDEEATMLLKQIEEEEEAEKKRKEEEEEERKQAEAEMLLEQLQEEEEEEQKQEEASEKIRQEEEESVEKKRLEEECEKDDEIKRKEEVERLRLEKEAVEKKQLEEAEKERKCLEEEKEESEDGLENVINEKQSEEKEIEKEEDVSKESEDDGEIIDLLDEIEMPPVDVIQEEEDPTPTIEEKTEETIEEKTIMVGEEDVAEDVTEDELKEEEEDPTPTIEEKENMVGEEDVPEDELKEEEAEKKRKEEEEEEEERKQAEAEMLLKQLQEEEEAEKKRKEDEEEQKRKEEEERKQVEEEEEAEKKRKEEEESVEKKRLEDECEKDDERKRKEEVERLRLEKEAVEKKQLEEAGKERKCLEEEEEGEEEKEEKTRVDKTVELPRTFKEDSEEEDESEVKKGKEESEDGIENVINENLSKENEIEKVEEDVSEESEDEGEIIDLLDEIEMPPVDVMQEEEDPTPTIEEETIEEETIIVGEDVTEDELKEESVDDELDDVVIDLDIDGFDLVKFDDEKEAEEIEKEEDSEKEVDDDVIDSSVQGNNNGN